MVRKISSLWEIKEGDFVHVISTICVATYDVVWLTQYRLMFSPTREMEVLEEAKKFYVQRVDKSWRDVFASCCSNDSKLLRDDGWNENTAERMTVQKMRKLWGLNDDESLACTAEPDGPAYCHVDKHKLEAGNHLHTTTTRPANSNPEECKNCFVNLVHSINHPVSTTFAELIDKITILSLPRPDCWFSSLIMGRSMSQ
jgi:hypothetical protein